MADVEVTYKGNTIGSLNDSGSLTLETAGMYLEGDVGIGYTAPSGGGGSVKVGALRPDAELWKSWTYDKMIVADEGVTLPAYSTNTVTLKNTENLEAVALDKDNYSYFLTTRTLAIPIYSDNTMRSGMELYLTNAYGVDICFYKASEIKALDGTAVGVDRSLLRSISESNIIVYYTDSVVATDLSSGNGAYCTPQVPSATGATLTVRSPVLRLKGGSSYLNSAAWGYLTDIRYQYVIELWRTPRSASPRGYVLSSQLHHVLDCVANNNGKLT